MKRKHTLFAALPLLLLLAYASPGFAQSPANYQQLVQKISIVPESGFLTGDGALRIYLTNSFAGKAYTITYSIHPPGGVQTFTVEASGNPLEIPQLGYNEYTIDKIAATDGSISTEPHKTVSLYSAAKFLLPQGPVAQAYINHNYSTVPEVEGASGQQMMALLQLQPLVTGGSTTSGNPSSIVGGGIPLASCSMYVNGSWQTFTSGYWCRKTQNTNTAGNGTFVYLNDNCTWGEIVSANCLYSPGPPGSIYSPSYGWQKVSATTQYTNTQVRQLAYIYHYYGVNRDAERAMHVVSGFNTYSWLDNTTQQNIYNDAVANYKKITLNPSITVSNLSGPVLTGSSVTFQITSNADVITLPSGYTFTVCGGTATISGTTLNVGGTSGTSRITKLCVTKNTAGTSSFNFCTLGISTAETWLLKAGFNVSQWFYCNHIPCADTCASASATWYTCNITAAVSGPAAVCAGSSAVLTASATGSSATGLSYAWNTGAATASITVSPAAATTYTVVVTGANGCKDTMTKTVSVNNLSATATAGTITCTNATATVSAAATSGSGNYSYSWSGPGSFSSTAQSFTTTTAGTYTVTVTDNITGCSKQATAAVSSTINNPVVTLSGNNPVCTGAPVVLTATVQSGTGVAPFTYVFKNNSGTVLQSGSGNTFSVVPNGISSIIVEVTGANGCKGIQSVTVNSPGPNLSLTNIVDLCQGQSTTLSADNGGIAGYTYLWTDNNSTNAARTVTPAATTAYTVVRTTAQGCKDTATATVQVYLKPAIQSIAQTQPSCTASTGSITVTAAGSAGQLRYRLNGGAWQTSNVFSNLPAGSYTVTVGNQNGICNDTTTAPFTLAPANPISSGIAGPGGVCALEYGAFQASPGVSGATYAWAATGNPAISGSTASAFNAQWTAAQAGTTQTISLVVSLNGCTQTYTKPVVVSAAVFAAAGQDKAMCPSAQVQIGLAPGAAGPPGAAFSWTPTQYILNGATSSSALVNPPVTTQFVLTVTDPINGCSRKDTVTVLVDVAVNPVADAGPDKILPVSGLPAATTLGGPLTTLPGTEPNTTIGYQWTALPGTPISALSSTNVANPLFTRPAGVTTATVYRYVFMVQKQYVNPATNAGVTCPVSDTVEIHFEALPTEVKLSPKVLLQGALYGNNPTLYVSDSIMRDNLRLQNKIPLLDPYPTLANPISGVLNFGEVANPLAEQIGLTLNGQIPASLILGLTGNNAIVDWVFLELRSAADPQTVVATRSALLQRDGDVVDMDGFSPVTFSNLTDLNCHLVVRHRNHLGVMTAQPLMLTANTQVVDFTRKATDGGVATYGTHAEKVLPGGRLALWAGNVNTDRFIIFNGANNDLNTLQFLIFNLPGNPLQNPNYVFSSYTVGDVDLRGTAIFQGTGNDANYISENIFSHPGNTAQNQSFIIFEQVPPRNN